MKKNVFSAAIVAALGIFNYALQRDAQHSSSYENLSSIQVENLEAVGDIETWVELGYAENCESANDGICVKTPTQVHYNSVPFPYFD